MERDDFIRKCGEYFQEFTKYKYATEYPDMAKGKPEPNPEKIPENISEMIKLPEPEPLKGDLQNIILKRKSRRNFNRNEMISTKILSSILFYTAGVRPNEEIYFRMTPSAGALHPLNTYILINRVESIPKGIYLYIPSKHGIVPVNTTPRVSEELTFAALRQEMVNRSNITIIWTAEIYRAFYKYMNRAYRYIYLDAGHACQNAYLVSEALALGACAIAALEDESVSKILKIDGKTEFPIYMLAIGINK